MQHRWLLVPALAALLLAGGPAFADESPAAPAPAAPARAAPAPAAPAPAAPAPAAGPAAAQTFGIQPASETEPDTRGTFSYGVTPGAVLKDHVAVWNYSEQPLTLRIYPADAFNTDTGGYDVLPEGTASTQAGSWLRTGAATLELPARSRQIVPFTLAVPATAPPGDHPAGIVATLRSESKDAKGNAVTVDQRVGARINIRVSGDLRAALKVEDAHAVYHPSLNPLSTGHTTISYSVRNTGNVRLGGRQAVRVANVFGTIATGDAPADLQELLPGNVVHHRLDVAGAYPTLWATAGITIDPLPIAGDKDPALSSSVDKRRFASIPWALLAVLLPLALLGGWWWRRRRDRGAPAAPPGGSVAPARPVVPGAPGAADPPAVPAGPSATAEPARVPAGARSAGPAGPGAAVTATTLLLAALALCQLPLAPRASAAEPVGTLAFDYAAGRDDDALDLLSSGQCPDPAADYLVVRITGEGFPAEGAPLTGTVAASVYRTAANGGYVLPLSNTLRVVATRSGAGRLNGAYTITASCRGKVNPTSRRDFSGVLTFTTPTTWQAVTVAPEGLIHVAAAAEPAPVAAPSPAPAAVAAAAPRPSGTPWYSLPAVGAGALLLGRIALPHARRWRRRPAPEAAE
ncbi:hypothetical protein OG689_37550 [Kitasatospora sp. NBC_00240]|uniref:hypothetical protein n=1 Tax=Kitasatospora sp. NBC_00240 TaxID=2903567 RepID=UPI0022550A06|nr:hypothetical protein [Kitasatospora sp. NBC_00240]MCX5214902.1 hypothetical protein [Kitasatospora sp. NBC_00240]